MAGLLKRLLDEFQALCDLRPIPAGPILRVEQHHVPQLRGARGAPRVVEQHERDEPQDRGVPRHQSVDHAPQPNCLQAKAVVRELISGGRRIALGKDRIDHREHPVEPFIERRGIRRLVGDSSVADFPLGAHQALRHGVFAHEEGARHGLQRESAHGTKREGNPRLEIQRRVTAGKDQSQTIVAEDHDRLRAHP